MNTYYLKKFRKEAYKLYGIVWFENSEGQNVWNVGEREDLSPNYACFAHHCHTEDEAIKQLRRLRRNYILSKVRKLIYDRKSCKNNKQHEKL